MYLLNEIHSTFSGLSAKGKVYALLECALMAATIYAIVFAGALFGGPVSMAVPQ